MKNWQSGETGNTGHTRRRKTKQNYNTIFLGYHYTQTNTNNINKTWGLLQATGGKDEPNIVFYAEIVTDITTHYVPQSTHVNDPSFKR